MLRNVKLEDISDGRLYSSTDMVKAFCNDCDGCHSCCTAMGQSIILDPFDVYRLTKASGKSFEQMLERELELNVVDGVILPNLKMTGEKKQCSYLDIDGRCSVHEFRPGICRLFPLGRYYEDDSFKYILQTGQCERVGKIKVKVSKWVDTENLKENEKYIMAWHDFLRDVGKLVTAVNDINDALEEKNQKTAVETKEENDRIKTANMLILNVMFVTRYDEKTDFYPQFYGRLGKLRNLLFEDPA